MSYLHLHCRNLWIALLLMISLSLAACQSYTPPSPLSVALEIMSSRSATAAPAVLAAQELTTTVPTATAPTAVSGAQIVTGAATGSAPSAAAAPVRLSIPELDLDAEVTPMGWETAMDGDRVTTRWVVPLDTLGWAVNSAEAGAPGNVVVIGHQAMGAAPLRSLALGEIAPGQEIRLVTAGGVTHLYQVSEVSPPIAAIGATAAESAQAAAYLAPDGVARLTLVSGWPSDTTTHRLFVVADYVGTAP